MSTPKTIGEYLEENRNDTDGKDLRRTLQQKEFGYSMKDKLSLVAEKRAPGLAAKLVNNGLPFKIVGALIEAGETAAAIQQSNAQRNLKSELQWIHPRPKVEQFIVDSCVLRTFVIHGNSFVPSTLGLSLHQDYSGNAIFIGIWKNKYYQFMSNMHLMVNKGQVFETQFENNDFKFNINWNECVANEEEGKQFIDVNGSDIQQEIEKLGYFHHTFHVPDDRIDLCLMMLAKNALSPNTQRALDTIWQVCVEIMTNFDNVEKKDDNQNDLAVISNSNNNASNNEMKEKFANKSDIDKNGESRWSIVTGRRLYGDSMNKIGNGIAEIFSWPEEPQDNKYQDNKYEDNKYGINIIGSQGLSGGGWWTLFGKPIGCLKGGVRPGAWGLTRAIKSNDKFEQMVKDPFQHGILIQKQTIEVDRRVHQKKKKELYKAMMKTYEKLHKASQLYGDETSVVTVSAGNKALFSPPPVGDDTEGDAIW